MLNYLLAWIIALGSLGLFLSEFFVPEVHRKNDRIWSGVGVFYALVLWLDRDRISGGLLLGQMASVALIVWLGWQTLQQRRQMAGDASQTPIPSSLQETMGFLKQGWERIQRTITEGSAGADTAEGTTDEKSLKIGSFSLPLNFSNLTSVFSGSGDTSSTPTQTVAAPANVAETSTTAEPDEWDEDEPEKVIAEPEPETEVIAQPEPETEAIAQPEPETEVIAQPEPETEAITQPEPETEAIAQPEPETEVIAQPEPETEAITQPEPEVIAPMTEATSPETDTAETLTAESNLADESNEAPPLSNENATPSEATGDAPPDNQDPASGEDDSWPPQIRAPKQSSRR